MFFSSGRRVAYRPLLVIAALAMAAALGCGPSKATVTGTVTYSGQPLPSGTITFESQAGAKTVKGSAILNGKYTISDFPTGLVKVTVMTTPPSTGGSAPPGGVTTIQPTSGAAAGTPPGRYVPIPPKYSSPTDSGLTYEVKGGEQTKDFPLTP
jgi:hypothetical protein